MDFTDDTGNRDRGMNDDVISAWSATTPSAEIDCVSLSTNRKASIDNFKIMDSFCV